MNSASQVYKLHIATPLLWVLIRELFLPPHRFNLMSMFFISGILGVRVTKFATFSFRDMPLPSTISLAQVTDTCTVLQGYRFTATK